MNKWPLNGYVEEISTKRIGKIQVETWSGVTTLSADAMRHVVETLGKEAKSLLKAMESEASNDRH